MVDRKGRGILGPPPAREASHERRTEAPVPGVSEDPPSPRPTRWRPVLRTRAMVAFGGLALVVSSLIALVSYGVTRSTLVNQREQSAQRQAYLNARSIRSALDTASDSPSDVLSATQISTGGNALLRSGGKWFATSVAVGRADVPRSLLQVVDDGAGGRQRIRLDGRPVVTVGVPIVASEAQYFEFVPMTDLDQTLSSIRRGLALAALATTAVGMLAGRAATARVLRPVRRMAHAANLIHEGSLDRRLESDGDGDLEPLVESFNQMVDGLHERIEREARFASDVSHELRSPLASMAAALSVARRRAAGTATMEALDVLGEEVDDFSQLIMDLLEISRVEAGVAELVTAQVDPTRFAEEVLASTHRDGVALAVGAGAGPAVALDKRRLSQVLTNLLDNAENYAGGATQLLVDGDVDHVRFCVDDAGPGVPEEERSYIFGRFARGTEIGVAGTGLGLALAREHVRLHEGTLDVTDAPGGGARFVVVLPRVAP